jgi:hypothetical protein
MKEGVPYTVQARGWREITTTSSIMKARDITVTVISLDEGKKQIDDLSD